MSTYPEDRRYTREHEWAHDEGELVRVGITAHAVAELGDITLVDLPALGTRVEVGERLGDIESVKTVSELFSPVAGEVVGVNDALRARPELVNESPHEEGWIVLLRPSSSNALDTLLSATAYAQYASPKTS